MATIEIPRCKHCKRDMRMLQEKTGKKKKPIFVCEECDGKLKLFARFDGDLPREA